MKIDNNNYRKLLVPFICAIMVTLFGCGVGLSFDEQKALAQLDGQWRRISSLSEYGYEVCGDDYSTSVIEFYKENGIWRADYYSQMYESTLDIQGLKVRYEKTPLDETTVNRNWSGKLLSRRDRSTEYYFSLEDETTLVVKQVFYYDEPMEDGTDCYVTYYTYVPDDDNYQQRAMEASYLDTVEVSTVEELWQAIKSNTHIILKAGIYNISKAGIIMQGEDEVSHVDYLDIQDVQYLYLEGEAGAEVRICTESPMDAPLTFTYCNHLRLENLTLGHEVEKGFCSGSVILFADSYQVAMSNLHLYGSGAYGVDAYNSYDFTVNDTEIYECTYGLVNLTSCGTWEFHNCSMRDSEEYAMFDISDCYGIGFYGCDIRNNTTDNYYYSFIENRESRDILFENCTFAENRFPKLVADPENCIFSACNIYGEG